MKIKKVGNTGSNPPGDMIGAYGVDEYPDVMVDSSRINEYPVSFYEHMIDVAMIHDSTVATQPIFTLHCQENCSNNTWRGEVIAHLSYGQTFNSAFFGFPLTFLRHQDAAKAVDKIWNDFGYEITSISPRQTPLTYRLEINYPNPFNPSTIIKFSLPEASNVQLTVYNTIGQKVKTLVNQTMNAGSHSVQFDGTGLPSGVYIYRLKAEEFSKSRKMLLVK
jgi:hypothetical protein